MLTSSSKTKIPGQIMVIVLLLLSVLTIIALSATLTASRDTQEQTQNKQYEQYYSLGENIILDLQRALGNDPLWTGSPNFTKVITDATGNNLESTCSNNGDDLTCIFDNVDVSQVASGTSSAEKFKIQSEIKDTSYIKNYTIQKDQDMLINLENSDTNETFLIWSKDSANNVSWVVSYDYLENSRNYKSDMAIYNAQSDGKFTIGSDTTQSQNPSSCIKLETFATFSTEPTILARFNTDVSALGLSGNLNVLRIINTSAGCGGAPLYFRIRPLRQSDDQFSISLYKTNNSAHLQRTITTITSTASDSTGSYTGNQPTVVQETNYILVSSPSPLFDYVLRTEDIIDKH